MITEPAAENLLHRAASAWGHGDTLQVADGIGGWVDVTKLFEQYLLITTLKGNN